VLIRGSADCAGALLSLPCGALFACGCGETFPLSGVEPVCAHTPLASNVKASADKLRKLAVRAICRNKPAIGPPRKTHLTSNGLGADRGQNMAGQKVQI
jgi:hypothetical protein